MIIFNATQHTATADQVADGVVEPDDATKKAICKAITFNTAPTGQVVINAADMLAFIVKSAAPEGCRTVMIGGAPFFMIAATESLRKAGFDVVFAFSVRESIEATDDAGNVVKKSVFRHAGFVPAVSHRDGCESCGRIARLDMAGRCEDCDQ